MKLKTATLLALIGVILGIIPSITHSLINFGFFELSSNEHAILYNKVTVAFNLLGNVFLIPFFITLYRNQK